MEEKKSSSDKAISSPKESETLVQNIAKALSTHPKLSNDSILAVLITLVTALHKMGQTDEYLILRYCETLETLLKSYDLAFLNSTSNGESLFISIDLLLKLLKVSIVLMPWSSTRHQR